MDALVALVKSHPGPWVLLFAALFKLLHGLLRKLPTPKVVLRNDFQLWKWRNLSMSIVHSLLTGTWAISSALIWPETISDIHRHHTSLSYLLVCISTGYFVEDAFDIIHSGYSLASWEFLLHHALVISSFLYTLYTHLYVAAAVITLFVEVNSVTLHMRLLLKVAGATSSTIYDVVKVINICTFVVFRLTAHFYLSWYLACNYSKLENANFFACCLTIMNIMILVYFYRLIRSDFLRHTGRSGHAAQNGKLVSKKFLTD
ncbi:TLC domain-containing protein 1-like [Corythoichthys intestinalis]|uniref:TLC domain-containing protein 1-like n=1 Tax=Corythoichthys intestinalis TaxID=161448 RepID=UPI0025A5E727|nr:TLC domain-containing protein 1-like [Corythoichthys intestinalis]